MNGEGDKADRPYSYGGGTASDTEPQLKARESRVVKPLAVGILAVEIEEGLVHGKRVRLLDYRLETDLFPACAW